MWVYRTSRATKTPIVLYDYQEGRSGESAKKYLSGYSGYLQTDGWGGYQKLEEQGITLCGCWAAHARRKFKEALAVIVSPKTDLPEQIGITYCDQLFALERQAERARKGSSKKRKASCRSLLYLVGNLYAKTLAAKSFGKAFTYAQNQTS
jgi:transposase